MDFWISVWISADGVRDFFRDGPLVAGKSEDFDKALKFALCCIGKGDFTLKEEQLYLRW